jgi:hypothetical protein
MRTMYDAVTAANIPRSAAIVAGYVDKIRLEPWSMADWDRFPTAVKVTIVKKTSTNDGHVLDVEIGDATPAEAPGWVKMRRGAGADPTVYCNSSTWPAVRAAFAAAKVAEPHYWIARYDGDPTIPAGAVAKQYRGDVAPGYDVSSVADYWPGVDNPQEEEMQLGDTVHLWTAGKTATVEQCLASAVGHAEYIEGQNKQLAASVTALSAAVAASTKDPAITADAIRQIVTDAVQQHMEITGEVHIGPTP